MSMNADLTAAVLIGVMSLVTALLRFLPFLVFRDETPEYILYLGDVLPPAIIGMLVVYCLRDLNFAAAPYGVPEFISLAAVAGLQAWKRSPLVSILAGTAVYMILIRIL